MRRALIFLCSEIALILLCSGALAINHVIAHTPDTDPTQHLALSDKTSNSPARCVVAVTLRFPPQLQRQL